MSAMETITKYRERKRKKMGKTGREEGKEQLSKYELILTTVQSKKKVYGCSLYCFSVR